MSPNDGAIHNQALHIRVIDEVLVHFVPDVPVTPAGKALVDAIPVAIFLRQLAPLSAGAQDPVDAFDESPTISFFSGINAGILVQKLIDF